MERVALQPAEDLQAIYRYPLGSWLMTGKMLVALLSLEERGILQKQKERTSTAHRLLQKTAEAISKLFFISEAVGEGDGFTVKFGCFEFRTNGFWVMYKAYWSNPISNEQC
ncbi:MAG: hypothetical protein ACI8VW_001639 [bacterium]|jgi:hypothetical protein